jgi:hypothetical protein
MTTQAMQRGPSTQGRRPAPGSAPLPLQVLLATHQNLVTIFRRPAAVLPPIAISLFFLVIYNSALGEASGFIPSLGANS